MGGGEGVGNKATSGRGQTRCGHARRWSPKGRRGKETLYLGATDLDLNVEHLIHHLSALTTWSQVPSK